MIPDAFKIILSGRVSLLLFALILLLTASQKLLAAEISGTILETMDASGYTYMNLDTGDKQVWVAIPQSKVSKGDKVYISKKN